MSELIFFLSNPESRLTSELGLVLRGLHLENIGDDGVDLHVADQPGEEELLEHVGLEGAEGGEDEEEVGEPVLVLRAVGRAVLLQLLDGLAPQLVALLGRGHSEEIYKKQIKNGKISKKFNDCATEKL